ncbi:MAG: tRNA dihydrouridine synthase [Anaerolineaceae bacterium]
MTDPLSPSFLIQNVPVFGRFILAPMDGFTDSPMRNLCRSFGSAMSYSEFLNAIDVTQKNPHLKSQIFFKEIERPFVYQIYDDKPDRFLLAATKLSINEPDIIDMNLGCSAKNVSNRGAGAGLLKTPQKVVLIASALVNQMKVPISAKIRLGWDENTRNYLEIAHILEDCGISAIAVHARTRRQEYSGKADWNAIAEVKQIVKIPVIGNGDILSYGDGLRMLEQTGCDAVMIGRAAIGNPWIFANSDRSQVSTDELFRVIQWHLNDMIELYSEKIAVLMFRKHLVKYLSGYLITPEIRRSIFSYIVSAPLLVEIQSLLNLPNAGVRS